MNEHMHRLVSPQLAAARTNTPLIIITDGGRTERASCSACCPSLNHAVGAESSQTDTLPGNLNTAQHTTFTSDNIQFLLWTRE
jgi:hypothetical protein